MTEEGKRSAIQRIYEDKYKLLMIIPFLILILAIGQIAFQQATTGEFLLRGVSLKGGISLSVPSAQVDTIGLEKHLSSAIPQADFEVRKLGQTGIVIDASDVEPDQLLSAVGEHLGGLNKEEYSIEQFGSSLGASFFRQTFKSVILAFLFMGLVVFFVFRNFAPSIGVILAAFSDMVCTLAIVNLLGIKLSTAGIAAFLMLIGYSVDTDILLSTRVLKRRQGTIMDRVYSSMKTGLTMTFTTMVAIIVALVLSKSPTITQIMTILLIGLIVDIIMTYIQNVGILRWFLEKKKHGKHN